jgi:hypothetical protein
VDDANGFLNISHISIKPGQAAAFSRGAIELSAAVERIEDGPPRWELFLSEDHLHGYLAGHYKTSEEWLRVASTTVPIMKQMLEVASFSDMVILGSPSGEARKLLARFAPRFCGQVAGYRRHVAQGAA